MGLPVHPKPEKHRLCMAKLYSGNNPRDFFHTEQSCVCGFRSNQYTSLASEFVLFYCIITSISSCDPAKPWNGFELHELHEYLNAIIPCSV